ncbi:hypothetical protein FSARC_13925 [Fusarium sarcochroum]|uniref:Metallo-beta-lactamase domain-containing protein n=1 Tax=Fusarium sarcochroum TaxID=1208366 RepID=A0A8H4SXI4_9HYPO|nr:hypothetical protein FSARC_13925 [Fusarium sarcochroum]
MAQLLELDAIEISVIVDNELDPLSPCPNELVKQSGGVKDISMHPSNQTSTGGREAVQEFRMSNICCSAHGLSLMITGIKDGKRRTILFDTGPEEEVWERNAKRLKADIGQVEAIVLSHWHRDHSGGMLRAIDMIESERDQKGYHRSPVKVDLHPDRPEYRGVQIPGLPVVSLEADPTFAEIGQRFAVLETNEQPHTILDDMFLVSGKIPRVSGYESGMKFGVRFDAQKKKWVPDEEMADERILVCRLKSCGHAGVVNSSKLTLDLGKGLPLYGVVGGFHLADAKPEMIERTVSDLKESNIKVVLAGHCTGWRAKYEFHKQMPGSFVPCFVGSRFEL